MKTHWQSFLLQQKRNRHGLVELSYFVERSWCPTYAKNIFEITISTLIDHHINIVYTKGTQDPGQRLSTPVQFFKLWSHWSKNDGSNLGSHWWKYCLRICAKPNIWNNNNVRNWTFIVLQGVIRAVDQGKGSHQQAQPLPEVRVFYLAYLQKHLFALWMGSGEAQIWRWSEWDLGTWGLGSHESGEDEA